MKNWWLICSISIGVLACSFVAYEVKTSVSGLNIKIQTLEQTIGKSEAINAALFELISQRNCQLKQDTRPLHVLCLGNSITFHSRRDEIEWYSEWGMAASKSEKDYCHQLENLLKSQDTLSSVVPMNIASWERGLRYSQVDSLVGEKIKGKDAVVIRLGENVTDIPRFEAALDSLVTYCLNKAPKVVLTGCFWRDDPKELSIMRVSRKRKVDFVPLFWIDQLYDARVHRGGIV